MYRKPVKPMQSTGAESLGPRELPDPHFLSPSGQSGFVCTEWTLCKQPTHDPLAKMFKGATSNDMGKCQEKETRGTMPLKRELSWVTGLLELTTAAQNEPGEAHSQLLRGWTHSLCSWNVCGRWRLGPCTLVLPFPTCSTKSQRDSDELRRVRLE